MSRKGIDENFKQMNSEFYGDYDFQLQFTALSAFMAFVMCLLKLLLPDYQVSKSNLTIYLTSLVLLMQFNCLARHSFAEGYKKMSDETKMQLLFAFKSFVIVWVLLSYTEVP